MNVRLGMLALALVACDDHDHGHEEPPLGEDACEHLAEAGEAVTATAEPGSAPDAGQEHQRYDVALPEVPGGGHSGHVKVAIGDAVDHVFFFDADVNVVVTDAGGTAVTATKSTTIEGCDTAVASFTVAFGVGTYDVLITAVDPLADEVSYVLLSTEEHEH